MCISCSLPHGMLLVGQGLDEIIKWWVQVQVQVWYHVY